VPSPAWQMANGRPHHLNFRLAQARNFVNFRPAPTALAFAFQLLIPMTDTAVLTPGAPASVIAPARERLDSVDLLRGIVMVLMALDHTRDFFHAGAIHGLNPLDLETTTIPLFLTRWITHFCAPTFIFLAGAGAFLSGTRGKSKRDLSWFLLTRGAWLIVLELTFIRWAGWTFNFDLHMSGAAVIWAIGWSMIVLAALVHLPLWAIMVIGLTMILGHNAFDRVTPESWGSMDWLWRVLHARGRIEYAPGYFLGIGYPLVPWIGVMAVGYGFGWILLRERTWRRKFVLRLGIVLTFAFVVLRFTNLYGDARPWSSQTNPAFTVFSFLGCVKYPPSLCYLLMTLGPALIVLAMLDRDTPKLFRPLLVFGRVPMFYYLLHLPLIHGLAVLVESLRFGSAPWLYGNVFRPTSPPVADAGFSLLGVYVAWLIVLVLLFPVCRWLADLKRRRRDVWLSYF
jgi:uncharacterized membrane protein